MNIEIHPALLDTLSRVAIENNTTSADYATHIIEQHLKSQFSLDLTRKIQSNPDIAVMRQYETAINEVYAEVQPEVPADEETPE